MEVTETVALTARGSLAQPRKGAPVKVWAGLGAFFVVLQIGVYGAWILSDDFQATPTGATPVPGWMKIVLQVWQAGSVIGALVVLYIYLVKPRRRSGRLTFDGLLCLSFFTLFWQNSLISYFQWSLTWNAYLFNRGGWEMKIPGWFSPRGNLHAEPLLALPPMYILFGMLGIALGCRLLSAIQNRYPDISRFALVMVAWGCFMVFDAILEPLLMTSGVWTYPGAVKGLTVFHGRYFQFPVYEAVFWGGCWAAWACLRYFRNDKGESIAERGLDRLRLSSKRQSAVRFLALSGYLNVAMLGYSLAWAIVGLYASPWPADIMKRSYLTNGFCGAGTTYACPGPGVPVPRRSSVNVDPAGQLVGPRN